MAAPTPHRPADAQYDAPSPPPTAPSGDHNIPKRRRGKRTLVTVVTLVVAAAAWFGVQYALADKPVHAASGDCVHIIGGQGNPEVSTVPCTDSQADYTVVRVVKNTFETGVCNNLSDAALAQQLGDDKFVLCLNKHKQ